MNITLKVWRQKGPHAVGAMETHEVTDITGDMSFLEMMDVLNDRLIREGKEPVAFDHDCREGICGSCSMFINGEAHGPGRNVTTCQLHMRSFKNGETIHVEPWRSASFPIIKDLSVDRGAFDRIIQAGGTLASTPQALHRMQTRFLFRRQMLMKLLMQQLVSVVGRV